MVFPNIPQASPRGKLSAELTDEGAIRNIGGQKNPAALYVPPRIPTTSPHNPPSPGIK